MSGQFLPVNQVRLTNVAVVRMTSHGKRFEVACYRNKIINYRQKIETDLSEVLQTDRVFTNVSKGQFAPTKDLIKAFGTSDQEEVCRTILDRGQVQISDMERSATLENTAREVANMVATKCVHPVSNRPYTTHQIRDAMKVAEFSVQPTSARSVKQQFLDCVRAIQERGVLDIMRARMELALVFGEMVLVGPVVDRLQDETNALILEKNKDNTTTTTTNDYNEKKTDRIEFLVDPSVYRAVDKIAKENGANLEIVRQAVTQEGDADVSSELERKTILQSEHEEAKTAKAKNTKNYVDDDDGGGNRDDDIDVDVLTNNISSGMALEQTQRRGTTPSYDDNNSDDDYNVTNTRKKNKRAQKKSKKAKRREKEEASLRQERIDAEKTRREEREFRLKCKTVPKEGAGDSSKGGTGVGATESNDQNNSTARQEPQSGAVTKSCNTCGGAFTAMQYRAHFQSEWHRYNMKLKMKGAKPVEEREFLLIDSDAFFDGF